MFPSQLSAAFFFAYVLVCICGLHLITVEALFQQDEAAAVAALQRWEQIRLASASAPSAATTAVESFPSLSPSTAPVAQAWQPGANKFVLTRPEGQREYYVYVPKSYTGQKNVSVIIAFHGLNDVCTDFGPAVGFSDYAEQLGFLYVYPCGSNGLIGIAWNAGTCCLMEPSQVDDVAFTRDIFQQIQATFNVNSQQFYATGFSNGAFMAERLACEASDLFSAAAAVSGAVILTPGNDQGLSACDAAYAKQNRTIPILLVHGDADIVVPWGGNGLLGFPSTPDDFARWSKRNQCTGQPVQTFNKGTFTNQLYTDCPHNSTVQLMKNAGGSHSWPRNNNFDTTDYIVKFFISISDSNNQY